MPGRTPRVLLVDDDEDDIALLRRALRGLAPPIDLEVARDGGSAVARLHASDAPPPDLILLDAHRPGLDGIALLRDLRRHARTRLLPIVVLSGSARPEDVRASYEHGANSHLCKPVTYADFVQAVGELARYWLVLNEAPPAARP